jgi:hypothetical protein
MKSQRRSAALTPFTNCNVSDFAAVTEVFAFYGELDFRRLRVDVRLWEQATDVPTSEMRGALLPGSLGPTAAWQVLAKNGRKQTLGIQPFETFRPNAGLLTADGELPWLIGSVGCDKWEHLSRWAARAGPSNTSPSGTSGSHSNMSAAIRTPGKPVHRPVPASASSLVVPPVDLRNRSRTPRRPPLRTVSSSACIRSFAKAEQDLRASRADRVVHNSVLCRGGECAGIFWSDLPSAPL